MPAMTVGRRQAQVRARTQAIGERSELRDREDMAAFRYDGACAEIYLAESDADREAATATVEELEAELIDVRREAARADAARSWFNDRC